LTEQALHDLYAIILNEHEANLLGKSLGMDTQDKRAFAETLCKKYNLVTLITLGGIGSIVAAQEGMWIVPPLPITPIDTVGAGAAYTGYFCAALDQGKGIEEALRWASVAGSVACTKVGAQTALPVIDEVLGHVSKIKLNRISSDDSSDAVQPAVERALRL
jgi:ribokinase